MTKTRKLHSITVVMGAVLPLVSTSCDAQEHQNHKQHHSHQAFSDKEAVAKMAQNFESAERDSIQQPEKVLQFIGNIEGKKIIDIGAATGYFSVKFANKGANVIAADVSDGFQEYLKDRIAKEKIENIELRKIPYDTPLLDHNEADIVFIANTYHHIENRINYFSIVKQGLKPDGELIIVDFFKVAFEEKIQAPAMQMRVSVDEIVFELKEAGFTTFDIEVNLLAYQYIIKAKKK